MQRKPITDLRDTNKTFEDYVNQAAIDYAISEAEKEFKDSGELLIAEEALTSLRRKRLG